MRGRAAVGMDDHRGDAHHPVQPVFESSERQTVNDPRVYGSQRRFYDPAAADVVTCHQYGWCVAVAPDTIYLHCNKNHGGTPSQTRSAEHTSEHQPLMRSWYALYGSHKKQSPHTTHYQFNSQI